MSIKNYPCCTENFETVETLRIGFKFATRISCSTNEVILVGTEYMNMPNTL